MGAEDSRSAKVTAAVTQEGHGQHGDVSSAGAGKLGGVGGTRVTFCDADVEREGGEGDVDETEGGEGSIFPVSSAQENEQSRAAIAASVVKSSMVCA